MIAISFINFVLDLLKDITWNHIALKIFDRVFGLFPPKFLILQQLVSYYKLSIDTLHY